MTNISKDLSKKRKIIAIILLLVAVAISIAFLLRIKFPQGYEAYFNRQYYN